MDKTLGKRIMAHRKRLGLTQDQLAEKLGVTAQAVSKWENDQSCPDITTLPRLAEIFGVSTDTLLGVGPEVIHEAEVVTDSEGFHVTNGNWEFSIDGGKKNAIGAAVLVLLVGALLLASTILSWDVGLWQILWPSALLVFGLWWLYPRFSFFRLGCGLCGGYFLLMNFLPERLDGKLILPIIIILFGLGLLADALRKKKKPGFQVHCNNKNHKGPKPGHFAQNDDSFEFSGSFGESHQYIAMPRLGYGDISVSFGEYSVDLSGVEAVSEDCALEASCSFGELTIRVPRRYQIRCESRTTLAELSTQGQPDPAPAGTIRLDASVSFGEITVCYV